MSRLEEEYKSRKEKIEKIESNKVYPAQVKRTHHINDVLVDFESLKKNNEGIYITGRVRSIRLHGGSCFIHVEDGSGKIQAYVKRDTVGQEQYSFFKDMFDIGDFIQLRGTLFTTKKGEKTVQISNFSLLSKALLPLPEKWHGLSDVEIRYRKRYLDLIANSGVKDIFQKRAQIIKSIRSFLDQRDFIEVETPILQPIPGGANAKPFITHHNALNTDLYLRIAPELYLKRLIIGGYDKVYEIARCFRNEGIDRDHNPEFTQVEFYAAYWDYQRMMDETEKLIKKVVYDLYQSLHITYEQHKINFTPPYERITFRDAIQKNTKINIDKRSLFSAAKKIGADVASTDTKAKILDELFKTFVRPKLVKPTFIIDYPIELSPLAKKKENDPRYAERFQLVAATMELCNAFSELNDPLDQMDRFKLQEKMRSAGDEEAQRIDDDFIEALSHGMPPTAGIGIGIDRLTSLLTNTHNIKEVILFPILKPLNNES